MSYQFYNNFPYSATYFPTMLDNKDPVNHVYFTGLHTELQNIERTVLEHAAKPGDTERWTTRIEMKSAVLPSFNPARYERNIGTYWVWDRLRYADNKIESAYYQCQMPCNYAGGKIRFVVQGKADATSGTAKLHFLLRAVHAGQVHDAITSPGTILLDIDIVANADNTKVIAAYDEWDTNLTTFGAILQMKIYRDTDDPLDTMAGDFKMYSICLTELEG